MEKINDSDINVTSIKLCGVQGCCPTIDIYHSLDKITIIDDKGGNVTLTKAQWLEAVIKVKC